MEERRKKAKASLDKYESLGTDKPFPSITISSANLVPQGSFAERQAEFLSPKQSLVDDVCEKLKSKHIGIVAHFYMDAEIQGFLTKCSWPEIVIADSLAMGDAAVRMVQRGMKSIICMGVDFMSENCRAALDMSGFPHIPVYKVTDEFIGCSLSEAAQKNVYYRWLEEAKTVPKSVHVIYINTTLLSKAKAHSIVPTITCTSSNVMATILQLGCQIPGVSIWYGPDSCIQATECFFEDMGKNLTVMLDHLANSSQKEIQQLHPEQTQDSIRSLIQRFHYNENGYCLVHHMFGSEVVRRIQHNYVGQDIFYTAHLEVPGEMFEIAATAQKSGMGVVGSTSNILNFILDRTKERAESMSGVGEQSLLRFILGTEAGMCTSIIRKVQKLLEEYRDKDLKVEIIFPVSSQAVAPSDDAELGVVPGCAGGEGCSIAGGCAACPFMKMNSLRGLLRVIDVIGTDVEPVALHSYTPRAHHESVKEGVDPRNGVVPIKFMRQFQKDGTIPNELIEDILGRNSSGK